jgi:putative ABC transport system permease protein
LSFASLQSVRSGIKSLALQKLRAALAASGIFIGTTAVIWLVAMGEGVSYEAQQQIEDLGATNIIVRSVEPQRDDSDRNSRVQRYGVLRDDYRRMLSNVDRVINSVPIRELKRQLHVGDHVSDSKLVGCTADYLALNHLSIARGRWFNSRDSEENVIVLADETARRLFPYENPIGRKVWVESDVYDVIGQTAPRQATAAIGGSLEAREYNLDAYVPLDTFHQRVGDFVMWRTAGGIQGEVVELTQITLTLDSIRDVDPAAEVVSRLMDKYHDREDYAVVVPKELLRQAERTRAMFNVLLVVIAGISLVVGGIGVMNIMLATVTERTREIGIRRAMGATRGDITRQFLIETVMLTGAGGLAGLCFGLLCGPVFRGTRFLVDMASPDLLPEVVHTLEPRVAPWSILLSLYVSLGVGLVFGVYPARQAAQLDPIEALRHE